MTLQEHEKAKAWRERHKLSAAQLATHTGYSAEAIYWFERGQTPGSGFKDKKYDRGPIKKWVWQRYKRACEGVDRELHSGKKFDW